ncbi:MAG: tRNA dihydrouridine synthase, partial [Candidatus Helarchaeota archaeon]
GKDPKILSMVMDRLNSYEFDGFDLNLGCPSPDSIRDGIGGALLRTPKKIPALLNTMLDSTNKAVSAKIRIGFDGTSINALKVAKLIEREGADFMTIHGRTVHAKYSGTNNLDVIRLVKQKIDIPLIGNGDIIDGISARRMLEKTKCDLIMVGRAAIGYPNIFQEINQYLKGLRVHTLSRENYKKVLQDYFTLLQDTHPNEQKDPKRENSRATDDSRARKTPFFLILM